MDLRFIFEDYAHKIAYLLNVINSYFIIMGISSIILFSLITNTIPSNILPMFFYIIFLYFFLKRINFFPYFLLFTPIFLFLFIKAGNFNTDIALTLLLINFFLFFATQVFNYYIPYLVVFKNIRAIFHIIFNSFLTIAPTNSSILISVYYSTFLSYFLLFQPNPINNLYALLLITSIIIAVVIVKRFIPKTYRSKTYLPKPKKRVNKIIYLNIDGLRFDKFNIDNMPFLNKLKKQGVSFKNGARSVYPALTNPAFASILTGTIPEVHKIMNNNITKGYNYEALPDIIKTSNYGNIHFHDVSKKGWDTTAFEISKYGLKVDDVLFERLEKDIFNKDSRLFIADISLVDIIGHAYGSYSKRYTEALKEIDKKLEKFIDSLKKKDSFKNMVIIISSDHGHAVMDHGYTLFSSENTVPLIIIGKGIRKNTAIEFTPSICDITVTICYLLGVRYPKDAKGRVLIEVLK